MGLHIRLLLFLGISVSLTYSFRISPWANKGSSWSGTGRSWGSTRMSNRGFRPGYGLPAARWSAFPSYRMTSLPRRFYNTFPARPSFNFRPVRKLTQFVPRSTFPQYPQYRKHTNPYGYNSQPYHYRRRSQYIRPQVSPINFNLLTAFQNRLAYNNAILKRMLTTNFNSVAHPFSRQISHPVSSPISHSVPRQRPFNSGATIAIFAVDDDDDSGRQLRISTGQNGGLRVSTGGDGNILVTEHVGDQSDTAGLVEIQRAATIDAEVQKSLVLPGGNGNEIVVTSGHSDGSIVDGKSLGDNGNGKHNGDNGNGKHHGDNGNGKHHGDNGNGKHHGDNGNGKHHGDNGNGKHHGDNGNGKHGGDKLIGLKTADIGKDITIAGNVDKAILKPAVITDISTSDSSIVLDTKDVQKKATVKASASPETPKSDTKIDLTISDSTVVVEAPIPKEVTKKGTKSDVKVEASISDSTLIVDAPVTKEVTKKGTKPDVKVEASSISDSTIVIDAPVKKDIANTDVVVAASVSDSNVVLAVPADPEPIKTVEKAVVKEIPIVATAKLDESAAATSVEIIAPAEKIVHV